MNFNPNNHIIKRCLQGMAMAEAGKPGEAGDIFLQAWNEATHDFEKFIAAWYVARQQENIPDKLKWFEIALEAALIIIDDAVRSALPTLYSNIASCYRNLNQPAQAEKNYELAALFKVEPNDKGPFFHGTKADLQPGDLLTAGNRSNYQHNLVMNHIYFTALVNGAGLAAALARGDGRERVYVVEPMGSFENDPNVTDKKFPGNLTRSYRTEASLKIVGEVTDWAKLSSENVREWQEKLAKNEGKIIN